MGLALDEPKEAETVQVDGLQVLMDSQVQAYSEDQVLDYMDSSHGQGFLFRREQGEESGCC